MKKCGRSTIGADGLEVFLDPHAQIHRVGLHDSAREQIAQESRTGRGETRLRPRAVHDQGAVEVGGRMLLLSIGAFSRVQMHSDLPCTAFESGDTSARNLQPAVLYCSHDLAVNGLGNAMPQYIPARRMTRQEFASILERELLPDALRVWPQFVHDDRRVFARFP